MSRNTAAIISLSAVTHNLNIVKKHAPHSKILAMVKANAYGHGLLEVAGVLKEADALGVACVEEALQLVKAGIRSKIVLMEGFFDASELPLIQEHGFYVVLHHQDQLQQLQQYDFAQAPISCWLKVNLGMNRLGFELQEIHSIQQQVHSMSQVKLLGLMGHLSDADDSSSDRTIQQSHFFSKHCVSGLQNSLANSAAIMQWPQTLHHWVRPGIMIYGASPLPGHPGPEFGLQPVMTFKSTVISLRTLAPGARVGYGGTWQNGDSVRKIAIVAAGYGDGYPRHAVSGTPVLINGQRAPLVGRVSMDMLAVDVTGCDVHLADEVVLWGDGLPVEEIAHCANTISYELFCHLTRRVNTRYIPL